MNFKHYFSLISLICWLGWTLLLTFPVGAQNPNQSEEFIDSVSKNEASKPADRKKSILTVFGTPVSSAYLQATAHRLGFDTDEAWPDLYPGQQICSQNGLLIRNILYPNLKSEILSFSDHPECVKERGLLFKGGLIPFKPLRFQYYHEGGKEDNRLWLRLDLYNYSQRKKATVMLIEGEGGPNSDYFQAGHGNNVEFLKHLVAGCGRILELNPRQNMTIFCQKLPYCQVLSGTAQFTLLEGSEIGFSLHAVEDPQETISFNLLSNPKDVHARGLYACADQFVNKVLIVKDDKASEVRTAVGAVRQPNIDTGPELKGDYGVVYALQFLLINETEKEADFELIINPRGGKATATILEQADFYNEIKEPASWLRSQVPDLEYFRFGNQYSDRSLTKEAEPFTEYKAASLSVPAKQSAVWRLLTIPEGASNYPVRFIVRRII